MAERPLVSVLTPTYRRHDLLLEAIENVRQQTYPNLEHIVVVDGPDERLRHKLWSYGYRPADLFTDGGPTRLRVVELGRHWTAEWTESYTAAPMMAAQLLAAGDYHSFLADDERMAPEYLETMVATLEATGADFAYPRVAYYRWQQPEQAIGIGADPPQLGGITTLVYRASMLEKTQGPYRSHVGRANDWEFVTRALNGGAKHIFVDRVLFTHRDDRDCPPELYAAPLPEYANSRG